jgi:hypothetical protein
VIDHVKEACMRVTWIRSFGLVLALMMALAPLASAQEAQKPTFAVQGDAALIFLYVKAEKTAGFETMMGKLKEALAKDESADVKQQIAGLKILKAPSGPAPAGAVLYIMLADPAVKNVEYWFLPILYKAFPAEAKAFYDQWQDVKHTTPQTAFDLQVVLRMQ